MTLMALWFFVALSLSARRAWIEIGANADSVTKWSASLSARRAWIEILPLSAFLPLSLLSLSARRAWIEIRQAAGLYAGHAVALRKESVDRNALVFAYVNSIIQSLSARRAWIEISTQCRL